MNWKNVATAIGRFMVFVANARQLRDDGRTPHRRHSRRTRAGSNPRRPISPAA
jgi:hypothetical protein